jgi:hypothetical protein
MTLNMTGRGWRVAGLMLAAMWVVSCSSSSTTSVTAPASVDRFTTGERISGQAVDGWVAAVAGIYKQALGMQAVQPGILAASEPRGITPNAVVPSACSGATVKYFNAQGQEQSVYDPTTTTRVTGKGPCQTSQGVVVVDVVVDDMQQSSSTMLINGTASGTYEGSPVTGTITDVRWSKQLCGPPSAGTIVALINGTTVTVRFDGSLKATATYIWNGVTVSFLIPLTAC